MPRSTSCRRLLAVGLAVALGSTLALAHPAAADDVRTITFPVEGPVRYYDDFGAPRAGHTHQGNDLLGTKLQRLLAATDGTVRELSNRGAGLPNSGNRLVIRDSEGWEYWYIHINNDSPGTDDNLNPLEWAFAPGLQVGSRVTAGQFVAYLGDSGNAESAGPHLHFEIHRPDGTAVSPYPSLQAAEAAAAAPRWFLRNQSGTGAAEVEYPYGSRGDVPLACDWDGDGDTTPGLRRGGLFVLSDEHEPEASTEVTYGIASDQGVCGDWDGDGTDTIGIYRNGAFYLRNSNTSGVADIVIGYGDPGDRPVIGDWDGDGADTIGIFRNGAYYLRNTLTTGIADVFFAYGDPPDIPFVGDWNGDGIDTIGIYRHGAWFLRDTNTTGVADQTFGYGIPTDRPVIGDWDGDGDTTIGVYR
jgi:hypothetical protein